MSTLYRDYRPQTFEEVLGQSHIKISLQNEVGAGRPAHAYLFCGPRAVGKTTLARVLARAVNCERRAAGQSEPCNECPTCASIKAGRNLEVVEIDAASNTGVDNVRENIIAFSRVSPTQSKFKVFIIDEVHMLSISAFNALLKILEEPPLYVIFILCTTEVQKVPATVISRCERHDFKRISSSHIVKKLSLIAAKEKMKIDPEVLEAVARRSGGHLRDAESLLGQMFSLGDGEVTAEQAELVLPNYNSHEAVNLLDHLVRAEAAKAIGLVNSLMDSGVNIKTFTSEIINLLRRIMLAKLSPELAANLGLDLGEHLEKRLGEVSQAITWDQIFSFTRRIIDAAADHRESQIPQLPLELAIAELCLSPASASPAPIPASPARPGSAAVARRPSPSVKSSNISQSSSMNVDLSALPAAAANLEQAAVLAKWPEFLLKIKKYNHSLSFVLQNCEPQGISGSCLNIVFKYKFHQDRINDANVRGLVESALAEVFGRGLNFQSALDENLVLRREEKKIETVEPAAPAVSQNAPTTKVEPVQPTLEGKGGMMADLLKNFGGEVIS